MTVPVCITMPPPPDLPELEIPSFGIIKAARQSLYDLPDLSTYIMSMQDAAAAALAPLRRYLEMIELLMAFQECQKAVVEALLPPDPEPILDCLKNLVKAFAQLASYFPPLSYVKTYMSLALYAIQVLDEILDLFEFLDEILTGYQQTLARAVELGDIDLGAIVDCAGTEVTALTINLMDILEFVTPVLKYMLEPIERLMPLPPLKDIIRDLEDIPRVLDDARIAVEGSTGVPVLEELFQAMTMIRNAAVLAYNTLAPVVGKESNQVPRAIPEFDNF